MKPMPMESHELLARGRRLGSLLRLLHEKAPLAVGSDHVG